MEKESIKNVIKLVKHTGVAMIITVVIVLLFFKGCLPSYTNHGETITVPDVQNQHISQLDGILVARSLRYEVNADSGYAVDQDPLTVIDQFPLPGARVKEDRKVYVTLNAQQPPLVRMPDLIDKSLMISQITLRSYGLLTGEIEQRPDLAFNVVLEQSFDGEIIEPGTMIPKGSTVDLAIGDGFGNREISLQNYGNQPLEDVRVAIYGSGLVIGEINYTQAARTFVTEKDESGNTVQKRVEVSIGYVVRQRPEAGSNLEIGDAVDLWVFQPEAAPEGNSMLDE